MKKCHRKHLTGPIHADEEDEEDNVEDDFDVLEDELNQDDPTL
jgi:hypothetical protein